MGQYYTPLLLSAGNRAETLYPHAFDSGAKLMEHSWIGNDFVNAAYTLIFGKPKKVAWIGDYSDDPYNADEDTYAQALPHDEFKKYYDIAMGKNESRVEPKLFSKRGLDILSHDTTGMYLLNHSKRVYINMEKYIHKNTVRYGDWAGYCVNPLPLLTACGNDRGGGDFREGCKGYEDVGIWAFDTLEYSVSVPENYLESQFRFMER